MAKARRIPLNALRVFEAVAAAGSFSRATEQLQISQAAISQAIRSLESYCGTRLFEREGRRVSLTEAGHAFLDRMQPSLNELSRAIESVRGSRNRNLVTLTTFPSFMSKWIVPRLPDFFSRYPKIELRVVTDRRRLELGANRIDVAVRRGSGYWPRLFSRKILDDYVVPICSSEIAMQLGRDPSPKRLQQMRLIQTSTEAWSTWFESLGAAFSSEAVVMTLDDSAHAVDAAIAGAGIVLSRWTVLQGDLAAGRVVQCHPHTMLDLRPYYFVCMDADRDEPRIRDVFNWFSEHASRFPTPENVASDLLPDLVRPGVRVHG